MNELSSAFAVASLVTITRGEACVLLSKWGHKMGEIHRGNQEGWNHVLLHGGIPVAVTCASLIATTVGGAPFLNRENCIELSRLCAVRPGLCRVMLRMWREFIFPSLGYANAISYQDAELHNGNTYRFDGWQRIGFSRSGTDTRSGRKGRSKYVWLWPPQNADAMMEARKETK